MATENEVINLLNNGWTIDYAPLTGEILLIGNHTLEESKSIEISMFFDMRSNGIIKKLYNVKNTHPRFRGLVDIYGLNTEVD